MPSPTSLYSLASWFQLPVQLIFCQLLTEPLRQLGQAAGAALGAARFDRGECALARRPRLRRPPGPGEDLRPSRQPDRVLRTLLEEQVERLAVGWAARIDDRFRLAARSVETARATLLSGELPPKGTVLAPDQALCEECPRRESKPLDLSISEFKRPHEVLIDEETCLLAQGLVCLGPATRAGCGAACVCGNMPCSGCSGPTSRVLDHGGKAISGIVKLGGSRTLTGAFRLRAPSTSNNLVDIGPAFVIILIV